MSAAKNGHAEAYQRWFASYETERKKRRIAPGRPVPGHPAPPPGPDEVRRVIWDSINPIGEATAARLCTVHRTTIGRWLDGSVQIPPSAYAILLFHAEGIPPGCGAAWRGFSWQGDAVICPDGKTRLTAMQIAGLGYQQTYQESLEQKVRDLEAKLIDMARRIDWGCANDSFASTSDPRAKAFTSP